MKQLSLVLSFVFKPKTVASFNERYFKLREMLKEMYDTTTSGHTEQDMVQPSLNESFLKDRS